MKKSFYLLCLGLLIGAQSFAQTTINVSDADIQAGQIVNWTKNNVYLCDGIVFVEDGATLNIEAGTVVKFTPRADVGNPSALVICRGAKIFATGTADEPIIFTAEADDVNNPTDLGPKDNALWGGLVILGKGETRKNGNAEANVEGIPTSEARGLYGGTDNTDNSGVLRYVSIRHGGRILVTGSELNGLTLGAVGSGTTLDYVEVYANSDDGIEFFGGAPNLKHAIVAFTEDDSYDWDEVYTGQGQFWFSIQRDDIADLGGELDGTTPDDGTPYSAPTVYNWTHIGSGAGAAAANPLGLLFRAGTAGTVANSIITAQKNKAIEVQDKTAPANDSHGKLVAGELKILNNLFWANGSNSTLDAASTGIIRLTSGQTLDDADGSDLAGHLTTNKNAISNPEIQSISRTQDKNLDPRPAGNTAVTTDLATYPANAFFDKVNYKGAFGPLAGQMWARGWSTLDRNNHLKAPASNEVVFVNDNSIRPCESVTWTKDKTYIVDGLTFVDSCATLTIEAGTVVKFTSNQTVGNPSALIVARGGKLFAQGTETEPIIFTAEADDVANPTDLGPKDNALWGGIAILGSGVTRKNGNPIVNVEGIPTSEVRGLYGGTNNADNSGVLSYVSIRHCGRAFQSGNELNGLTLAGVGSGTKLDHIEIYASSDDGIEFFGGAPELKYAVVAWAEDDSYDWDEVYTGKGQFWFSIQRDDVADLGGELDGTTPDDATPYSNPTVYNWTHIGSGPGAAATNALGWLFRAGTAGTVANSIVTAQKNKAIEVQDKAAPANDSYTKMLNGELKILNNLFWANGATTTIDATTTGIIRVTSGTPDDADASDLAAHLTTNKNAIANPQIVSISRTQNNQLDPRTKLGSAAYQDLATYPVDPFFTGVDYKGAFDNCYSSLWIAGWTALARNNHLAPASGTDCLTVTDDIDNSLVNIFRIFPNPAHDMFVVESNFDREVSIEIYDMAGRLVAQMNNVPGGKHQVQISTLVTGLYAIKFRTEDGRIITKKLIVE